MFFAKSAPHRVIPAMSGIHSDGRMCRIEVAATGFGASQVLKPEYRGVGDDSRYRGDGRRVAG